jgi:hypothetical protein
MWHLMPLLDLGDYVDRLGFYSNRVLINARTYISTHTFTLS